jgi:hypothetical protein
MESLSQLIENYQNTAQQNDELWESFTKRVDEISYLKEHRDFVEEKKAGYGDRAFHYMWYLLLKDLKALDRKLDLLEIGVFKGQVISLWSLLARELGLQVDINGISPLEGNYTSAPIFRNYYFQKLRSLFDPSFRRAHKVGNIHVKEDFVKHIQLIFSRFNLDFGKVNIIKGYSNDAQVIEQVKSREFDLIYIDGDHSYEVALSDIHTYSPLLRKGGYLIVDDASSFIPGTKFFKGILEVSKACEGIETLGLSNVLNIGHNRVFRKD